MHLQNNVWKPNNKYNWYVCFNFHNLHINYSDVFSNASVM